MTRRLMFIHAHPDDESSKGAATAARYLDDGAEVTLVTCTGGEAGEVLNPNMPPLDGQALTEARAQELENAVAAIGFTRTYLLGFKDSGYHEDAADVPEGTFARTPIDESAKVLAALVRRERPHVVVTYPKDGGYPHPDHIMTYAVTVRALALAEDPAADLVIAGEGEQPAAWRVPKLYATFMHPSERVLSLHEAMLEQGLESPFDRWFERRSKATDDAMDQPPDARVRCDGLFNRRDAALLAHVTQIDPDGSWFQVPRELEREHYPYESYLLLRSDVPVDPPESDLFAGIDLKAADAASGRVGSASR